MEPVIFYFEIYPINMRPNVKPRVVITHDEMMMRLFLQQHGFDPNTANVAVYRGAAAKSLMEQYSGDDLTKFTFGTRDRKRMYPIITTISLVEDVTAEIGKALSLAMSLGPLAARQDVEIFDRVGTLVDSLPYVYVKDLYSIDDSSTDEDHERSRTEIPRYYASGYWDLPGEDEFDDELLFEELFADIDEGKTPPINMETYVSWFVKNVVIGERAHQMKGC